MADKFDLVVIGAGPGGYEAAIEGVKKGMKVALVENRELGGTCLNRGCIPTKTIIHTAELYHELQSGPSIGLTVREPAVDMEMVQKRKDEVLEQLRKGIASLMKTNKISVYYGTGTILDREHVKVAAAEDTSEGKSEGKPEGKSAEGRMFFCDGSSCEKRKRDEIRGRTGRTETGPGGSGNQPYSHCHWFRSRVPAHTRLIPAGSGHQ